MENENLNSDSVKFVDNWLRGFISYTCLGFLFGGLAIWRPFWNVVKFSVIVILVLAFILYFTLYRSVINKKLREETKPSEIAIRETEEYVNRAVIDVLFLFSTASILGAWFFSQVFLSIYLTVLLVLLDAAILAYLHAKLMKPVRASTKVWKVSKFISRCIESKSKH